MKLNYRRTFLIGLAFLSISAFWQMYDSLVPLILQNTFHMNEALIGAIMAADNVLAVFLLPLIGSFSDKVNTPLGKRTPFVIGGTAVAVASMMMLPFADQAENLIWFVIALGVALFSMAMYRTPAVALMPDLTPKPLRSKANAVINLMGAVGGVYTLVLIKMLVGKGERPDYFPVFLGVGAIMVIAVVVLVLTIREKKLAAQIAKEYPDEVEAETPGETKAMAPEVKRSLIFILLSIFFWFAAYNAVTSAFSRYAITVWDIQGGGFADCLLVATIAAIISYLPIGIISSKIGRKKTIMGGIVLMFACFAFAFLFKEFHPVINIGFALIGVAWAAIGVNSLPMVVEMSKGSDIGKYTGLYYTFSMTAQILTPMVSGLFLQYVSYRTLFPYACVFTALAFVTMSQVKHGDNRPEKKKSVLENFDVED